jgi:hypothetical protein
MTEQTTTLMTEATNTTEADAAATQATDTATGAGEGDQQQQQAPEGQTTEGEKPEAGKTEDDKAKPEGAPETYEFTAPEGQTLDDGVIAQFSEVAKELNLSQDAAQKVLDKMQPVIAGRQAERLEAARNEWAESAKADKEFGGEKLTENLAVAKKAMDAFATPELRTLLNESGLGNHPEIIRAFYRAGKAISEDGFVAGGHKATDKGDAKRLYPNSNMN